MKEKPVKFALHTLGCKVNQYESDKIISDLTQHGWLLVDFSEQADVYIISTCTVTAIASHKSRQLIRRATRLNDNALVVATGCYVDSDMDAVSSIDGVSLAVGNKDKDRLPQIIASAIDLVLNPSAPGMASITTDIDMRNHRHTRALVKIQDGCNQFCSYCIVPHVRNVLLSKPIDEAKEEVAKLADSGVQEIVLTGIHIGLYGKEFRYDISDLVQELIKIPNLGRIRLSSIELNEVSPALVEILKSSDKLCKHLPIPLQSGSNAVLQSMNRHYIREEFIAKTLDLKATIPDLAITTDIIVGFPGEGEEDFVDTVDVVEHVGFSKIHVFKYSRREGTPAASLPNQIQNRIKSDRSSKLIRIGDRLAADFANRYIGTIVPVLIERQQDDYLSGISDNYIRVLCEGTNYPSNYIGSIVPVKITKQEDEILYGICMESKSL